VKPVRHPLRWLAAAVMLTLAVRPGLLPHSIWVQAVIGGLAGAHGYAMAALAGGLTRVIAPVTARTQQVSRTIGWTALPVCVGVLVAAVFIAHAGQSLTATDAGMTAPTLTDDGLAIAAAVLITVALVLTAAGVRCLARWLIHRPARVISRLVIVPLVPALVLTGFTEARAANLGNSTLGREGQRFLAGRPDPGLISSITGRPARSPVRIYVGRDAAGTAAQRAALAVADIEQAGGFRRSTLLIAVPTGSGWVNPTGVSALERLTDGDLTTVVLQYGASPSWWAYLRGGEGVQGSVRALTDALNARIARLPAARRPRLLIYGESLGAWGGLRAYPNGGIAQHTDGALWVGVAGGLPAATPVTAGQRARTEVVVHPDDPVPAWSARLILHPSASWPRRWLPIVSFWQATADVISAERTPTGFGHRYGHELAGAWCSVLGLAGQVGPEVDPGQTLG
jgi:uncharacterized membrane protein